MAKQQRGNTPTEKKRTRFDWATREMMGKGWILNRFLVLLLHFICCLHLRDSIDLNGKIFLVFLLIRFTKKKKKPNRGGDLNFGVKSTQTACTKCMNKRESEQAKLSKTRCYSVVLNVFKAIGWEWVSQVDLCQMIGKMVELRLNIKS